ncbi:MAG: Spy/CpxP family protein refolding chaperone [Devosiaceae bacterium]|nr:Spy/CpxP family protein refolding chaperone [Devosiaceae bacterium]
MKKLVTTILATAIVSAVSFTAFTSGAAAHGPKNQGASNAQIANSNLATNFVCSERGSSRIENGLDRISQRLDLSEGQTPAFDAFKSAALSAQSDFLQQCGDLKTARDEVGTDIDLIDRMNNRQALLGARLEAVSSIMPQLEIFYDDLSDEQKQKLRPRGPHAQRDQRMGMRPNNN